VSAVGYLPAAQFLDARYHLNPFPGRLANCALAVAFVRLIAYSGAPRRHHFGVRLPGDVAK